MNLNELAQQAEQTAAPSGLAAELDALRARSAPDFTQQSATPQAQPGSVPVTGGLAAELQALRARSSPQEVANAPQRAPSDTQQQTKATSAQAADVAGVNAPVPAADLSGAGVAATQAAGVDIPTTQGVPANVPQPAQPGTQASQTPSTQGAAQGPRVILQNRDRSTPSSIAQMRSIAARPDYGRLGFSRDFANGAPVVAGGMIQPAQMGRQDMATASDGRRIPVQYAVVDAASVLTSNTVDGSSNPSYGDSNIPAVRAIAGNGRIAGLQSAYQSGNANAYRQELVQDASLHGIAPEVIAPMAQPVLVRVMPAEAVTADIGDISNTVGNLDLSAAEQASNDANRVTLDALQFAEDGSITPEVVRQFVRAMPQAEQGQLLDTNGQPTRQAVDRLSAAVFAKAYGNEALTRLYSQAQDPEARLVMSALAQVAPKMARLEGAGALDIRDVVAQAAEIAVNARRQGVPLARAAQQLDMAADPAVGVVLDLFAANSRSVRPVVEALARAADAAYTEATKPAEDMFGAVPRATRADIINQLRPENERRSQEALEDAAGREPAAVDAVGQANDPAGSAASATTEAGRPAEDAATEGLTSYTAEEVAQRQAEAAQAEATAKRAEDAAARAEAAARQAKEIALRSVAAADSFELGQSGEDNLSGQGGLAFSFAGARAATADTPIATIRQSLASAYGNLLQRLESKGLVSLTQTDEDAIAAAAQARADKNGGDAEQIKQSLMASVRNSLSPMKSIDANVRRGLQSLAKALDGKTSVNRAMFRNGLGWVDFVWGDAGVVKPNGKTKGAMGISHILEARQRKDGMTEPQVIRLLEGIVDTIASGQELRRNETGGVERVVVERNGIEATLVKSKGSNAWLLSGWEVKNPDELSAANVATEPTLVEPTTSRFNKGAGFADIMGFNGLDVKRSADGNLEGFFDPETGKSYLIADNLTAESAPGTLMHEVGIHMAADGKLQPLFERAAQLLSADRGNAFIQRVQARMDRSGETSGEEAAAYIVTEYENDRTSAPASVSKWVQDFIASVRAWLFNKGALLKADQLTVADIAAVARANARSMARGDGWMGDGARRFSKAPSASEQAGRDTAPSRIFYSRAPGSGVAAGSAPPIPTSAQDAALKWRDASGRLQFAPGAWLFDKMGAVASPVLSWAGMKSASPELKRQLREMKLGVQKAQQTSAMIATETAKLSQEEREMVSDLIEKTLKAGVIPPAHAVKLAALINETMSAQTDELIELGMLSAETAERWRGEYLPRFYADKLRTKTDPWADALKSITRRARVMMGMKGKHLKARGLFEVVPTDQVADYEALGWELRDPGFDPANDKTAQMWRDFTKEERESMGEIRDAGFRFVMGYMQTQKDIALGRMYKRLADSDAMSSRYATGEFSVRVPETKVEGTGANVYGALAGKYVSKDTLDHLSGFGEVHNDMLQTYRKAMSLWKEGKTVLNPVSHINNTVSNVTMAHLAGVGYHRVDKYAAAVRDLATSAPMVQQAKDAGLFLGGFNEAELFDAMPDELKALAKIQEGTGTKVVNGLMQVLTFGLRKPMAKAYEFEDSFFKYLIFRDARSRGMEAEDAVEYAQKYIFTYDDLPKTARRIRDFGLPFFAYTYKAVPALLEAALTHPVRMALPATAIWAATTLAYALAEAGGDEPLDELAKRYATDEKFRDAIRARKDYDQEHLPKWMRGYTALAVPKSIRVGMDETLEMPLFMDISRVVPGGDIFDVTPNAGGLPLPQVLTPNHPVLTLFTGLIANKDAFKGSDLVDKNDTSAEAAEKRTAWVYRQVAPAMAVGNYHWDRGMEMLAQIAGGEIKWLPDSVSERYTGMGKDGLPIAPKYGIPQTFGIKIRPIDQEKAEAIERAMDNKLLREIDAEIRQINRLNSLGAMSDKMADKKRDYQIEKKDRIRDGLTVDGEAKD